MPAPAGPVELRRQMPALANKTYFNYGGQGPLPESSLEAVIAAFRTIQELGPFSGPVWPWTARTIDRRGAGSTVGLTHC